MRSTLPLSAQDTCVAIFNAIQPICEHAPIEDVRDAGNNLVANTIMIEARGEGWSLEEALARVDDVATDIRAAVAVNWERGK